MSGKNGTQSLGVPASDIDGSQKVDGDRFSVTLIGDSAVDWTIQPQRLRTELLAYIYYLYVITRSFLLKFKNRSIQKSSMPMA